MNAILKENTQAPKSPAPLTAFADLDRDLQLLADNRQRWVQTPVAERITILNEIKDALMLHPLAWAPRSVARVCGAGARQSSAFAPGTARSVIRCWTGWHQSRPAQ